MSLCHHITAIQSEWMMSILWIPDCCTEIFLALLATTIFSLFFITIPVNFHSICIKGLYYPYHFMSVFFSPSSALGLYTYYVTLRGVGGQPKCYQCVFHLYKCAFRLYVTVRQGGAQLKRYRCVFHLYKSIKMTNFSVT